MPVTSSGISEAANAGEPFDANDFYVGPASINSHTSMDYDVPETSDSEKQSRVL